MERNLKGKNQPRWHCLSPQSSKADTFDWDTVSLLLSVTWIVSDWSQGWTRNGWRHSVNTSYIALVTLNLGAVASLGIYFFQVIKFCLSQARREEGQISTSFIITKSHFRKKVWWRNWEACRSKFKGRKRKFQGWNQWILWKYDKM